MGVWLCAECLDRAPSVDPPFCARCGDAIVSGEHLSLCSHCRAAPLPIERIRSVVYFEGVLRKAVHQFKYEGITALVKPLGGLMAEYLMEHPMPFDVVVPVPLHATRRRERGFNQAGLLAREMARRLEAPIDEGTLVRQRATASQVGLNAEQRRDNVRDAFRCSGGALAGERVLLIDDVCTTGSTLASCAVALRDGGARNVRALTLARAR